MTQTPFWPPTFDAAIFDFDGTIADTGWIWVEVDKAFLGARGIEYTPEYARVLTLLGFAAGSRYTIETYGLDEEPDDVCAEWTRLSKALYRTRVYLKPGVEEYIKALRAQGVKTALATTNEPELIETMQHVDAFDLFDVRVYGREVGVAKDHPDIYLEAARRLGVEPGRCMVFEDLEQGLRSSRDAGFQTCAVKSDETAQVLEDVLDAADLFLDDWTNLLPSH